MKVAIFKIKCTFLSCYSHSACNSGEKGKKKNDFFFPLATMDLIYIHRLRKYFLHC